jgi:hypothetical protein
VTARTVAKIAVAGMGIIVFMAGARIDSSLARWIGIGLLGLAFAMRFVPKRSVPPHE